MKVRKQQHDEAGRRERPVAIAMASNGLPAQLLPKGTTVHKPFGLPVTDDFEGQQLISRIQRQSGEAELLHRARLIVWDEAPTMNKWQLDAVDRLLKDLMGQSGRLMGDKVVVLGGDFRQCGPVLKNSKGRGRSAAEWPACSRDPAQGQSSLGQYLDVLEGFWSKRNERFLRQGSQ